MQQPAPSAAGAPARPSGRRVAVWMLVVATLHVALAVPGLSESVWLDEAVTIQLCRLPPSLGTTATYDATPPVYYLLVKAWSTVFGCDGESLRTLSLLLSTLAAALLLALGAFWLNLQTGVVAAFLFSVSNLQLRYATEARCYALVELLLLVSYALFFALRARPRRGSAIALGLVNAALVQTHYVAALGLLPQLLDVALFRLRERALVRRWIGSQLLAVALCVPWALYIFVLRWPPITPHWLPIPDRGMLGHVYRNLLATSVEPGWYLAALVVLLLVVALRTPERLRSGAAERLVLLAAWGIGVPLVAYAMSSSVSVVLPRYLLFASLGLWLLLAYVTSLASVRVWERALLLSLVLTPSLLNLGVSPVPRPDWQAALDLARENSVPDRSRVVVSPEWEAVTVAYHELDARSMGSTIDMVRNLGFEGVDVVRDPDQAIAELAEKVQTLILVANEGSDHAVVLSMPQMCFFRERFTARPEQLSVRVLDRDCTIG